MNRALVLALLAAVPLAGCVVRSAGYGEEAQYPAPSDGYAEVQVNAPPPAAVVEARPYPPGPGYVWVDGYWDWTGYDWYWVNGFWAPPRGGYVYVRPSYVPLGGRWVYRRGYWAGRHGERDYEYARPSGGGWHGGATAAPSPGG